jgi:hypothetical protein
MIIEVYYISEIQMIVVGFKVVTEVVMNDAIFWDIAPCSPYLRRRFRGTYHFHLHGRK